MELTKQKQGWISKLTSGPNSYTQKSEICEGILKTEPNYRVTQEGKLVNYIGANQSYYEFYNDFCVDVNYKSGESIAIICENLKVIKKCCEKTLRLQEDGDGEFSCHQTDEPIFLNDISEIFNSNLKSTENYEFTHRSIENFKDYSKIYNFSDDHFQFYGNFLTEFRYNSDFCLDKLVDHWNVLLRNKISSQEIHSVPSKEKFLAKTLFCSVLFCVVMILAMVYLIIKINNMEKQIDSLKLGHNRIIKKNLVPWRTTL
jgi:hypothetical protein